MTSSPREKEELKHYRFADSMDRQRKRPQKRKKIVPFKRKDKADSAKRKKVNKPFKIQYRELNIDDYYDLYLYKM